MFGIEIMGIGYWDYRVSPYKLFSLIGGNTIVSILNTHNLNTKHDLSSYHQSKMTTNLRLLRLVTSKKYIAEARFRSFVKISYSLFPGII